MKTRQVGKRKPSTQFKKSAEFLDTVIALRGDKPFIPRGVYRFKTHEEAQQWSLQMMTRPQKKAGPRG